jgi:hypothetical protein
MMRFKYGELISMFLFQDATEADVRYLSIINTVFLIVALLSFPGSQRFKQVNLK